MDLFHIFILILLVVILTITLNILTYVKHDDFLAPLRIRKRDCGCGRCPNCPMN